MRENQIYTTSNYDDFVMRKSNRDIDPSHVAKISESMKENGWQGAPIEVSETDNGKLQIEDGQHRYMACKLTKVPVKFMLVKPKTTYDVAMQNSMKKGWTGSDYIHAYAEDGNFNYKRLKNLEDEFPKATLSDILEVVADGKSTRNTFRKGYMKINDEKFFMAREVLKTLEDLNESIDNIGIKTKSSYKRCLIRLLKHGVIDPQRIVDKMDKHGRMLLPLTATGSQAMGYLEALYNYHQPKNTCVFFRERLKNVA